MALMFVTWLVSISGILVNAEQPRNMKLMFVTCDVSSSGTVVNDEQPENMELMVVTWLAGLWTDLLWYDSVGFRGVFGQGAGADR